MSQDDQRITNPRLLGLKPYLESLREQCDRLSKQELTEVLLGLAKEARPRQRAAFLEKIDRLSRSNPQARWDEGILAEIEAWQAAPRRERACAGLSLCAGTELGFRVMNTGI